MSSVSFNNNFLQVEVLCVGEYLNYTLAGIGNRLFLYSDGKFVLSKEVFVGERVHSICVKNDSILLKGGRELVLVKLQKANNDLMCEVVSRIKCSDWIQDLLMFEDGLVGLVTAHNVFEVWSLIEGLVSCVSSEEKCILYSCKIIGDSVKNAVVLAGTVFGDVFIWTPNWKSFLHRLKSHNGAVFSIEVNPKEKLISTTSDDRSLKIWLVDSENSLIQPETWEKSKIHLIHTLYGHTARVWRSLIISEYYITIGEDSRLIVWSKDGKLVKSLSLHQESGIRALHYSNNSNSITTGGEDGRINVVSLKYLISESEPVKVVSLDQNFSARICYTKNGIAYTFNGGCSFVSSAGEITYKNENFLTYCLMEVSPDYIMLGSIKGELVMIDIDTGEVLTDQKVLNGRVYSIHWLDGFVLTCGPAGCLDFWEFSGKVLRNVKKMELPNCKERWTTCAVVKTGSLVVGDRMGNLYVYDLNGGENPVRSFRKIHGYLGVTDLMVENGAVYSTGRDGTVKTFTGDMMHSMTYKLPVEWPWKMVKYNDDILILGFHSVSFVVWSMKTREIIASHDCGGGHRSCDYKLSKNKLTFIYVKEKKAFAVDLNLDEIIRIRNGFHGKEINCLKVLQTNPTILITGSEDTTLRISKLEKSKMEEVIVLKTHISSVRAVSTCHFDPNKLLVLSVGGKGQIIVWKFDLNTLQVEEAVNHFLRKDDRNWKSSEPAIDPDTRVMCVDVFRTENEFTIATGCSDCQIRIFSYGDEFKMIGSVPYSHCILKIGFLKVGMLASMATDGRVVFWDVTDFSRINQIKAFTLHQSGINSFHFEEVFPGRFVFATGGDDNLISVAVVEISGREVNLNRVWKGNQTHSCQVTGMKIVDNYLLTTSIDQRITAWKWRLSEGGHFEMRFVSQCVTPVADVQGMDAMRYNEDVILVGVHGKGMEILEMDVCSTNRDKGSKESER